MLRIISGTTKGTVLETPKGENTRPTLGSTRESIFNVLANIGIIESRVLDVFAGTGEAEAAVCRRFLSSCG